MNRKILSTILFLCFLAFAGLAFAQVTIPNPLGNTNSFTDLLKEKVLPAIGGIVASLGTIMIIVAGILYLTSAGSPEKINKAKAALTYAIIGIVLGVAAQVIINVILEIFRTT